MDTRWHGGLYPEHVEAAELTSGHDQNVVVGLVSRNKGCRLSTVDFSVYVMASRNVDSIARQHATSLKTQS